MNDADKEPTPESLDEIPETDFSQAIRPNRYAALRGELRHAVFLAAEMAPQRWVEEHGVPELTAQDRVPIGADGLREVCLRDLVQ